MALYVSSRSIQTAVANLAAASAKARMCEFLIGLRALKLAEQDKVGLAESVPPFMQALSEYTRCAPVSGESDWTGPKFFNPFGSQAGYKSNKYQSNGPANTLHGWATQANAPFDITTASPKEIRRRSVSRENLMKFLLIGDNPDTRPRLIDAAIWFFRFNNVQKPNGVEPTIEDLEAEYVAAAGLTSDDVAALFVTHSEFTTLPVEEASG